MKIVYIHQYYKTPEEGGAIRSYYLTQSLIEAGHEVHVITTTNHKKRILRNNLLTVHYLPVKYDNGFNFASRIYAFLKFVWLGIGCINRIKDTDLVYASSTPLTVGLMALFFKKFRSIPFYFEVRDLWPEAPIQIGMIRNKWLKKLLFKLEDLVYTQSDQIICLSPPVQQILGKKLQEKKIHLIPNISDCAIFNPIPPPGEFSCKNPFKILYAGAIGLVNQLEYLIDEAAIAAKAGLPIKFLIAGEGSKRQQLETLARQKQLQNIEFLGHVNKYELSVLFNKVQAVFIGYRNLPVLETSSPNKLFDGLAAGKLIVSNIQGWIKDLIDEHRCGIFVDQSQKGKLTDKVKLFLEQPGLLVQYQYNARQVAENHFDKTLLCKKFVEIFQDNHYVVDLTRSAGSFTEKKIKYG